MKNYPECNELRTSFYRRDICCCFLTGPEFDELIKQEETYDPSKIMYSFVTASCYDHIWAAALALNCTEAHLKAIGEF